MAFDFPASPTTGQSFTPAGGPTYTWNGSGWVLPAATAGGGGGGGASITISDTPPGSPTAGSMWWESDTGILWIYFTDVTPNSQWVAVSSGGSAVQPGARVLIQRQDVSAAVAQVDFTSGIDATYDEYELHLFGVQLSTSSALSIRISQDGGATFKAGASDYQWSGRFSATNTASCADVGATSATILQIGAAMGVAASIAVDGIVRFARPSQSGTRKFFRYEVATWHATSGYNATQGMGTYVTDLNPINAIRLMSSAGAGTNLTAGTFVLYGIKK